MDGFVHEHMRLQLLLPDSSFQNSGVYVLRVRVMCSMLRVLSANAPIHHPETIRLSIQPLDKLPVRPPAFTPKLVRLCHFHSRIVHRTPRRSQNSCIIKRQNWITKHGRGRHAEHHLLSRKRKVFEKKKPTLDINLIATAVSVVMRFSNSEGMKYYPALNRRSYVTFQVIHSAHPSLDSSF